MERRQVSRRRALRASTLGLAALAGCSGFQRPEPGGSDPTASAPDGTDGGTPALDELRLGGEVVAEGLSGPVAAVVPEAGRVLVADQPGQVYLVEDGTTAEEPFLDVSDRLADGLGSEMGLLGLAVHPAFADDSRLFVRYSGPLGSDVPANYSHAFVLSEFAVDTETWEVDPDSERILLEIPEPQSNHNAGDLAFGPDGHLYVPVGDGGAGGDQGTGHVDDWYGDVGGGNGQDVTENLLGSVLRIDVDETGSGDRAYGVPDDNPLVSDEGRDEQYAWGFRNPWRLSFGPEGRLFVGDVGQGAFEEVDVVERGGNYGWNVREGTHCYVAESCPDETPDGDPLLDPVIEYPHRGEAVSGISVIGGYLYDGDGIPALDGTYVFGDYRANGSLFVAREADQGLWPTTAVPVADVGSSVRAFGRDAEGELLVCSTDDGGDSGAVHRLVAA